jgi:hypothetical protein
MATDNLPTLMHQESIAIENYCTEEIHKYLPKNPDKPISILDKWSLTKIIVNAIMFGYRLRDKRINSAKE